MNIYIIYKTTNLINGKYYIGKAYSGKKDFATYLGSGIHLNRAVKKYGRENFIRETLHSFDIESEAYLKEAEIVTEDLVQDKTCYNMCIGGRGGVGSMKKSAAHRKNMSLAQIGKYNLPSRKGCKHTMETRKKMCITQKRVQAEVEANYIAPIPKEIYETADFVIRKY